MHCVLNDLYINSECLVKLSPNGLVLPLDHRASNIRMGTRAARDAIFAGMIFMQSTDRQLIKYQCAIRSLRDLSKHRNYLRGCLVAISFAMSTRVVVKSVIL